MQGKAWSKDEVMEILKRYFKLGYNVTKACDYAGIPRTTVQTWIEDDDEIRLKVTAWQNEVNTIARTNLVAKIDSGDENTSKWWLERKERDEMSPSASVDVTSKGEKIEAGIFVTDFKNTEDK